MILICVERATAVPPLTRCNKISMRRLDRFFYFLHSRKCGAQTDADGGVDCKTGLSDLLSLYVTSYRICAE